MATKNPFQGDDVDPFSGARDKDGGIKKQSFGEAFAAARRAGKKTFTFKGKSYSTQTKDDVKKRDDADFAKEEARSKTMRAVSGDSDDRRMRDLPTPTESGRPGPTKARALNIESTRRDAETAADKRFVKDVVRGSEKTRERKRMQDDIDTAAAKRKVSGFAKGGKVRGAGIAKKGFGKCKIV
jgi:hypothetical protein